MPQVQFWPAAALYTWACGESWENVIQLTSVDEGDLVVSPQPPGIPTIDVLDQEVNVIVWVCKFPQVFIDFVHATVYSTSIHIQVIPDVLKSLFTLLSCPDFLEGVVVYIAIVELVVH